MHKKALIHKLIPAIVPVLLTAICCAPPQQIAAPESSAGQTERPDQTTSVNPADSPTLPARGFFMGILPMPVEGQSFGQSYAQMAETAEFAPVWGRPTPFYNLGGELAGEWGTSFLGNYIRGNGMFPLVHLSFIGQGMSLSAPADMSGATLENEKWRHVYKQAAIDVVRAAKPLYLSLGNEVNRWYEKYGAANGDPNGFQHYVSLYEETYELVKKLSPQTQVFCTFAREIVSENRQADMDVLSMFDSGKMDLLVLTSYPHAVQGINRPGDIPDDYYTAVQSYMPGKPFGFSEVAWPSLEPFGGEEGQADFLRQLTGRLTKTQGLQLHLMGWTWSRDLDGNDTIGLLKQDGTPKQGYSVWRSISLLGNSISREGSIPPDAVKITPQTDNHPPILHSGEYAQPVPLPSPVNTAGAEDSAFITPDGNTLYFFFTPDVRVPVEKQLLDGVTGIYVSHKQQADSWSKPERVILNDDISLDGCEFVQKDTMWFCSARAGRTGVNWFTAQQQNGTFKDWSYAGDAFPESYQVGELHITSDGKELYFHSPRAGGLGGYDIWVTSNENGKWQEPRNVSAVNTPENDGWPFISQDGSELWFLRTYMGTPALFRSKKVNGAWSEPEMIVSQFAGEPTLDNAGNLYFVHHYYKDGVMLEADIYMAKKK